ncbi:MAG: hypothetical protein IJE16_06335 [Ruminococcus sp.]|nr:hypothetical protein [Ruminococcus sp.]
MHKIVKCAVIILMLVICCSMLSSCENRVPDIYIFENISECENIEEYKSDDAVVTTYDTPNADKNFDDLEYDSFYASSYESDELDFEIFVYEFVDSDSAKEYFSKETGIEPVYSTMFLASGGMTKYDIIVIDESRAYYAETSKEDEEDLNLFLSRVFSKKLEFVNDSNSEPTI